MQAGAQAAQAPVLLPFPAGTGAAELRRAGSLWIVFDRQIWPASVTRLRTLPGFNDARITLLPDATLVRVAPAAGQSISLTGINGLWLAAPTSAPQTPPVPIAPIVARNGQVHLLAGAGGHVVMVPDPATGLLLAVGTLPAPSGRVASLRHFATVTLVPTDLGVAVDPLADDVQLRADHAGFVIVSDSASPLPVADAGQEPGRPLPPLDATRSFDLPDESTLALRRRLYLAERDAADQPLLARLPFRRRVAQAMLALGLGNEAGGVLTLAAADDPVALTDRLTRALAAAAALVAHRPDDAAALDAPDMPQTDEIKLWRALRAAELRPEDAPVSPALAKALAAGSPLLVSYPRALRRDFMPLVARTLLDAGALAPAQALLNAAPADPYLRFSRARARQLRGDWRGALAAYDALADSPDRSQSTRAAVAALDLRVSRNLLSPAHAADQANILIDAWRGDARERDLWLRIADWRGRAGQYRQQLEALRAALADFPGPADGVRARLDAAFTAIAARLVAPDAGKLAPFELVALLRENQDLLPPGSEGAALIDTMADRLAALDLPREAADALRGLLPTTTDPLARAALGARIAGFYRAAGQNRQALDVLAATAPKADTPALPEAVDLARADDAAAAQAALGQTKAALASLAALGPDHALLDRAAIAEQASDWQEAAADLSTWLGAHATAAGRLDAHSAFAVLRLASDRAELADTAGLAALRARYAGRFANKDDAAIFNLLTAPPVVSLADLSRADKDLHTARALPATLRAISPP